ncbi:hypothetical protein E2C01_006569 [Portunus trituberculatus]|uniref:Uncharacterized protein n=1 Tax=Portunus trituberculatus TaxID=210409 RepID=A0A5B7CY77_PORTR|nr:hypothetical protein [Portunus trituberculatus]
MQTPRPANQVRSKPHQLTTGVAPIKYVTLIVFELRRFTARYLNSSLNSANRGRFVFHTARFATLVSKVTWCCVSPRHPCCPSPRPPNPCPRRHPYILPGKESGSMARCCRNTLDPGWLNAISHNQVHRGRNNCISGWSQTACRGPNLRHAIILTDIHCTQLFLKRIIVQIIAFVHPHAGQTAAAAADVATLKRQVLVKIESFTKIE